MTIRPARTESFEHTISGLLTKRANLFNEAEGIRDRLAEIRNDIGAMDRTLTVLGYTGDLDVAMPRQKREVLFDRGELSKAIYGELRTAAEPLSTREIARAIILKRGEDPQDEKHLLELVKRTSKALCQLRQKGYIRAAKDVRGGTMWAAKREA